MENHGLITLPAIWADYLFGKGEKIYPDQLREYRENLAEFPPLTGYKAESSRIGKCKGKDCIVMEYTYDLS